MKKLLTILLFSSTLITKAGWTDMNTGINDDLTGVVFWGNNGLVSGHSGLYYTTTGGVGPSAWTHFSITTNSSDSLLYSNTQFNHAYGHSTHTDYAFACGQDTVNDIAVIFQFHIPTQAYVVIYQGPANTSLNNIRRSTTSNLYYAVGDNGLIVRFNLNTAGFLEANGGGIDYESVFFSSGKVSIGSNQYKTYGVDNDPGLSLTSTFSSGLEIKDYWQFSSFNGYAVGNSLYSVNFSTGVYTAQPNYNFGPLNANCIFQHSSYYYIGTDHGIFRFSTILAVEWQPSSLQHTITEFWRQGSIHPIYACGKNGVLLSTTDNGGNCLPFMKVVEGGGCKGEWLTMTGTYGSASSCSWYLNGTLVSSSCANYTMLGNTAGTYQIKFKGTNSAGSDSAQTIFYVVDTPAINLPVMILDTMLCKKEPLVISIDQSENDVYYHLIPAAGGSAFGNSPAGNGGLISYTTDSVSLSGSYLLRANSSLAACSKKFTDTISIAVEHTKAAYHVSNTNLIPSEQTQLFENCTDANNYFWDFPVGSAYLNSSLPDPINSFSNAGNQQIKLVCWSDNLCYDSIVGPGPTVYIPPTVYDSCWVNLNSGADPQWLGQYFNEITDITPLADGGYLTSGTFHDHAFATTHGDSLNLDWFGSYICKYDKNGVYKWSVHSDGAGNAYISAGSNLNKFIISSTAVDDTGNIYACGYFNDYFVDNQGDTIPITDQYGRVIKLDSVGKLIWERGLTEISPDHISIDNSGDIIVVGRRFDYFEDGIGLFLNGTLTEILPAMSNDIKFGITKFSEDGTFLWDVPVQMDNTNGAKLLEAKFDNANNLYLTGYFEYNATVYSTGLTTTMDNFPAPHYGKKLLLFKLSPSGELIWITKSYRTGGVGSDSTYPFDMTTDSSGNCYISGVRSTYSASYTHVFENVNGTTSTDDGGTYMLMKINKDGNCNWITGSNNLLSGIAIRNIIVDDSLYVIGMRGSSGLAGDLIKFDNDDGSLLEFTIYPSDYFISVYDTAGYLYRSFQNGSNIGNVVQTSAWSGFFMGENANFYASRNGDKITPISSPYQDFGDSIYSTYGNESWVTKFCEGCSGLTFNASYQNITDTIVCIGSSYTLPSGTTLSNITAEIHDTLVINAINTLDSLIITNIYVNGYVDLTDSVLVCYNQNYVTPDGTNLTNITVITSHVNMFQTTIGCDSIITTVITPSPPLSNEIDSVLICYNGSYTFMDGFVLNNITTQTTHDNYFTTMLGCDSIIQTIVYPTNPINTSISATPGQLSSNHPSNLGVTYQWIDCFAGYLALSGETAIDFTPLVDGSYAVIIVDNGCTDTSACEIFDFDGLEENTTGVTVFPNPTNGQIYISFDQVNDFSSIRILDALGQEVETISMLSESMIVNLPRANGIYYLQFISASGESFTQVISKM